MTTIGWLLCGIFLAELAGAWWHKQVSHLGRLSWIARDGIRARHRNHHVEQHGPDNYRGEQFRLSCEVSFHPLVAVMVTVLGAAVWAGILTLSTAATLLTGGALHGATLKWLHHLAHLEPVVVRRTWLFRIPSVWKTFDWLRRYHEVHHYVLANFGILPLADWLLGTYVDPNRLDQLKDTYTDLCQRLGSDDEVREAIARRLFPGLACGRTSDCTVALSDNVKTS